MADQTLKLYVKTVNREEEWPEWLPSGEGYTNGRYSFDFVRMVKIDTTSDGLGLRVWYAAYRDWSEDAD